MTNSPANTSTSQSILRWRRLDQARGLALIAMIIYHAIWDGLQFGLIDWTVERDLTMQTAAKWIAGSFLMISGVSLALAQAKISGPIIREKPFQKRVAKIAVAAVLVSIATFFALPQAPIYFGILHHIALASIILALMVHVHAFALIACAGVVLALNTYVALPALNAPALIWLGLGTQAPVTADWVPVVPWLAAGLIGAGLANWLLIPWLTSREPKPAKKNSINVLEWMGRRSLLIYLIHQPILIGAILLYQWIIKSSL